MALDGGGGGPVGITNSFTGTSASFNIYGDFGASYTGAIPTDNNELTHIEFTSGKYVIVGSMQPTYLSNHNENYLWKIYLDDAEIAQTELNGSESGALNPYFDVIVPAFTRLKITCQGSETTNTNNMGSIFTGRIYRE